MGQRLRDMVLHDFWMKLLALVIAALMWYGVARDPVAEVSFNVPIEFYNFPDNLEFNTQVIQQAQIRVRGPARVVRELAQSDIHPIIDLQGAGAGERTFPLNPKQIKHPHEVQVVQVIPPDIRVSFDHRAYREVEVRPRVLGTFASGYRMNDATVMPEKVQIVGPASRVSQVENAITDPVDATGAVGRVAFSTRAYISDPLVRIVNPTPIHVTVTTEKISRKNGIQ